MNRKPFHFKKFSIHHDKCAMKVGTDGVLLGAWTPLNNASNILDIGTGTGVIAIMLAQRSAKSSIDAIEIDEAAYLQALENVENCHWKDRVAPMNISLQELAINGHAVTYDLIVSNPPFFLTGSKPSGSNRINARHVDTLSHEELISCSKKLLAKNGILSIILPVIEGQEFIEMAQKAALYCTHKIEVKPKLNKPVERLLLSFSKTKPKKMMCDSLTIQYEKRNDYTPDYIALTKEFYTIM